ncbi:hypothetical protein GALMADRAFT_215929 [Galerina marginata CBS 339.88]|uniref:Uncharacterized protein n=1 Tax=Galerina marginata (strain CBS 339.88) TaxID=685588 RepID=A0A067SN94_GALM3|nr:hypothetical protein GALMADRAFT_215929 [Galerina marginata CBS 339.88]
MGHGVLPSFLLLLLPGRTALSCCDAAGLCKGRDGQDASTPTDYGAGRETGTAGVRAATTAFVFDSKDGMGVGVNVQLEAGLISEAEMGGHDDGAAAASWVAARMGHGTGQGRGVCGQVAKSRAGCLRKGMKGMKRVMMLNVEESIHTFHLEDLLSSLLRIGFVLREKTPFFLHGAGALVVRRPLLLPRPFPPHPAASHPTRERDEYLPSAAAPAGPAAVLRPAQACFASGVEAGRKAAAARGVLGWAGRTRAGLRGEREGGCSSGKAATTAHE